MNEIRDTILKQLHQAEADYNVIIPYAIESGSRAWGFASPDSDYDCRFIYVRPRDSYLSVFDRKDTIQFTPDAIYDVGGWDLKKVVQHLVKSNAVMLEWLQSPIAYRQDEFFRQSLLALGKGFFNPVAVSWHYLSMAKKKVAEIDASGDESKIKKYFYVLRPLACTACIRHGFGIPCMEYRQNLAKLSLDSEVLEEIHKLLQQKEVAVEGQMVPRNELLLSYFREECEATEAWLATARYEKMQSVEQADEVFLSMLHHVWR